MMENSLHKEIEAAKALRLSITSLLETEDGRELTLDDLRALNDSFDGETTLDVAIRHAVLQIEEDEIFITGCKAREDQLKARRARLEKRVEATRGLIEQAMAIANWEKHEMDIGVVSLGRAPARLEIDDESEIPTQFFKRQDPVLDKSGLGKVMKERQKKLDAIAKLKTPEEREAALKALDTEMPPIPGCHLEIGGKTLTIRRS